MPDLTLTRPDQPHPAHDFIAAHDAADLYDRDGVEWSVSGDRTLTSYGTINARRVGNHAHARLWRSVRPKVATTGIRIGDTITTWAGAIVVTRVGTIAGWGLLEGESNEVRWDIEAVREIHPANTTS